MNERKLEIVRTNEWYDFIGLMADVLPALHPGGEVATGELLKMCNLDSTSRVLDVGCGSGGTACQIAKEYDCQVFGIDLSEVMISKANDRVLKHKLAEKLEFRVADVVDLPFKDEEFDAVIIESVLTPFPGDKNQAVCEMVRVTKSGGLVAANEGTIDPESPPEILDLMEAHPAIHGHFTPDAIQQLFEGSGLQVIETRALRQAESPRAIAGMGIRYWIKFMTQIYPKILMRLLRHKKIRNASKIDSVLMKLAREHMGFILIVGKKPT